MSVAPGTEKWMRRALALARRARGHTSPNPMVGALLVRGDLVIGEGWHRRAGEPHAEIDALHDAARRGHPSQGATLFVTLEPCCTHGRTPPCTAAILAAGIRRVVVATTDPNPAHAGRGIEILRSAGIEVVTGVLAAKANQLNAGFNHWIVHRRPFVTLKAAMTLDGKIATAGGESKWITGDAARAHVLRMRQEADAVLVGVETVLADDPGLLPFPRLPPPGTGPAQFKRRVILDSMARTPLKSKVVTDHFSDRTLVIAGDRAPRRRVEALRKRVQVWIAPTDSAGIHLAWLMAELGGLAVTSLLVEGGGKVHASFLADRWANRVAFFYAPKILGGALSRRAVAGSGFPGLAEAPRLTSVRWRRFGPDLLLEGEVQYASPATG